MSRFLCCLFTLCLFCVGCTTSQQKQRSSQTVRLNIGQEPQALDPRKARHLGSLTIVHMLFEGLTRLDSKGKTQLGLAKRVEMSPDAKSYTFYLREALWTNGEHVKASDFVYAWKKLLSPDFPSDTAFHLYVLKNAKAAKEGKVGIDAIGVQALDEKTLLVELEYAAPYFLELVGTAPFFPVNQKVDEANPAWAQEASSYVGNGPFQLVTWQHQNELAVKKSEKYWDAEQVKLESLHLYMVNEETELKMFEKKELDWAGSPLSVLPLDALSSLRKKGELKTTPALSTYFLRTNTSVAPLNHPAIRKALALAIDRKAIAEHVTQGQLPATRLVPSSFGLHTSPYFQDADRKRARELFEEGLTALHMKKEELPQIHYLYRMSERNHLIAQAIQEEWYQTLGIRVRLEGLEAKVFFSRISKQDFHLAYADWTADFPDPINFLEVFKYKKGGSNNTQWENPEYIQCLDRSSQSLDSKERFELLAKGEEILMEEMPIIPVLSANMLYLSQEDLKGVVLSPMGTIDFKWARKGDVR